MVQWTPEQQALILRLKGNRFEEYPADLRRYKCSTCNHFFKEEDMVDGKCPVCGESTLTRMCPLDHDHCSHQVVDGIDYCPLCGAPLCPICGTHDVAQISRVTGYLQDVAGWNAGKRQELKDRKRVNIG